MISVYRWLEEHSRRLAVVSGVVLALLMVLWLSITTRTAMYYAEIDDLEQQRLRQVDQINQIWAALGEQAAPAQMQPRARALGFQPAALEFVLVDKPTATVSPAATSAAPPQP